MADQHEYTNHESPANELHLSLATWACCPPLCEDLLHHSPRHSPMILSSQREMCIPLSPTPSSLTTHSRPHTYPLTKSAAYREKMWPQMVRWVGNIARSTPYSVQVPGIYARTLSGLSFSLNWLAFTTEREKNPFLSTVSATNNETDVGGAPSVSRYLVRVVLQHCPMFFGSNLVQRDQTFCDIARPVILLGSFHCCGLVWWSCGQKSPPPQVPNPAGKQDDLRLGNLAPIDTFGGDI